MTGVTVGAPYSQAAKTAALSAIGGDAFPQTIPELLQQVVIASNANGTTGYVPSYATQAEADAVATAMAANEIQYIDGTNTTLGGPGTYIKSVTLVSSAVVTGLVELTMGDVTMMLRPSATYTTIQPPVTLLLGATQPGSNNCVISVGSDMKAIVTGYFTPTV